MWPFGSILEAWRVARLDRAFVPEPATPTLGAEYDALAAPLIADVLARNALQVAIAEIGHGETSGNNRGEWIRMYCAPAGDGHEWCAAFAGWCYQTAAERINVSLPFKRSLGAKRLGRNVGAVGRVFQDARQARPGDLIVWHRGNSWGGHVGIVERVQDEHQVLTVEGNSGVNVRRRVHDLARERFAFFASIRGTV